MTALGFDWLPDNYDLKIECLQPKGHRGGQHAGMRPYVMKATVYNDYGVMITSAQIFHRRGSQHVCRLALLEMLEYGMSTITKRLS